MAVKWTNDQQNVIDVRGSNLLVSAAAGSGKTAVLVERIIKRILDDENPIDIDRLLVVTFTRAAAAEMRERVTAAIEKRCIEEPDNERLQRQQALIHNAQITTIDSFCAFVVRNHFGDIELEPNFRVADTGELGLLEQDVIKDVFEACYKEAAEADAMGRSAEADTKKEAAEADAVGQTAEKSELNLKDFLRLVDSYSGSRSDADVREMITQIFDMSESSPWPKEWVAGLAENYRSESAEEFEQTDIMQEIVSFAVLQLMEAKDSLAALMDKAVRIDGLEKYAQTLENDVRQMEAVCGHITHDAAAGSEEVDAAAGSDYVNDVTGSEDVNDVTGSGEAWKSADCSNCSYKYNVVYDSLKDLNLGNMARVTKFQGDEAAKKYILDERGRIKKEIESLRSRYFAVPIEELYAQIRRIRPMAEALVAVSLRCMDAIAETKRQRRMVSFADMEHFALNILVDEHTKELRPAAEEFKDRFEEIMIDEYQDSNQVQEEILTAISRESRGIHNMFMVGDIKQSIYRFRLARPEIFMGKYQSYETAAGADNRKITLSRNFRSRPQVLDFVNDIFVKIMQPDLGSVAYDKDAMLYLGADYPPAEGMEAEVLLYDSAEDASAVGSNMGNSPVNISEDESASRMEIHMIAQRIQKLHGSLQVKDESGGLRPVRYGDMAILMRGVKSSESDISEILADAGIPVQIGSSTGYFSSQEVRVMLAFLQILDNPLQDIPLAAVLRSPIAGLSDEQLAQIRIWEDAKSNIQAAEMPTDIVGQMQESEYKPRSFAEAAWDYMEHTPQESAYAQFYELYGRMRSLVKDTPIHELIGRIYQETGYRDYVSMLPAGRKRASNLDMLVEKAADYEQTSYKGLFHFMRYIEKLHKYDVDFGEAAEGNAQEDAVSVMTIHKSKGLEFPVVFVAGTGRKFNQTEVSKKMLLHSDLGIGLNEIQLSPKRRIGCLLRQGIAERMERENLGEELRVLYVAMTRAKEKLILTGTVKDYYSLIEKYMANVRTDKPLSFATRYRAGKYLDWILPAMQSYIGKYEPEVYSGDEIRRGAAGKKGTIASGAVCDRTGQYDKPEFLQFENVSAESRDTDVRSIGNVSGDMGAVERDVQEKHESLQERISGASEDEVSRIRKELSYVYPYAHEAGRKSKYSVSELKHSSMLERYDREQNEAEIPDFIKEEKEPYVPQFVQRKAAQQYDADNDVEAQLPCGGALRGTAVHRMMECLDFKKLLDAASATEESGIQKVDADFTGNSEYEENPVITEGAAYKIARDELARMQESGIITQELADLVSVPMVAAFLKDPVALRMAKADAEGNLFREKPFVMEKDGVLIQGIIDVFWTEDDRIVLLDYKTDSVKTAVELVDRYKTQLELYAEVLGRLFGKTEEAESVQNVECMMYSFKLRKCVLP